MRDRKKKLSQRTQSKQRLRDPRGTLVQARSCLCSENKRNSRGDAEHAEGGTKILTDLKTARGYASARYEERRNVIISSPIYCLRFLPCNAGEG
jgi:hypothetical protein